MVQIFHRMILGVVLSTPVGATQADQWNTILSLDGVSLRAPEDWTTMTQLMGNRLIARGHTSGSEHSVLIMVSDAGLPTQTKEGKALRGLLDQKVRQIRYHATSWDSKPIVKTALASREALIQELTTVEGNRRSSFLILLTYSKNKKPWSVVLSTSDPEFHGQADSYKSLVMNTLIDSK